MSREIPEFFANRGGRRLFGILHHVTPAEATPPLAVVYCAPIFEEKVWSHRVAVNFARHMAGRGVPVLRFDYFGDGESEGDFAEASLESRVADIEDAVEHCRRLTNAGRVALVGLGIGGNLALAAANRLSSVHAAVAWSPIVSGEKYVGDLLRSHLTAQIVVHRKVIHDREELVRQIQGGTGINIEGYEIRRPLYEQLAGVLLQPTLMSVACRTLVIQVSPAEPTEAQYLAVERMAAGTTKFIRVRELKFWTQQKLVFPECRELFDQSSRWLQDT